MHFLKLFFGMLGVVLLVLGGAYVVYVEATVHLEASEVRKDVLRLQRMATTNAESNKCRSEDRARDYQLRFENETEYVLEVRCGVRLEPKAIDRKELDRGVVKVAGSGIKYDVGGSADVEADVVLKGGYRSVVVAKSEDKLMVKRGLAEEWQETEGVAETTCEGWGLECCSPPQRVGQGRQQLKVTDCSQDCFASCQERPLVHFFNTSPIMNFDERRLELDGETNLVSFNYQVDDLDGEVESVEIDFGDGGRYVGALSDLVDHTYVCEQEACVYVARIVVRDNDGLVQAASPNNELEIVISAGS